jgi:ligand-binding sensor domain-containing protein/signal transduction histidine kinase
MRGKRGMMSVRQNIPRGLPDASRILLLCLLHTACALADDSRPVARFADTRGHALRGDLKFAHLTTNDGLSQGYVTAILQDRRGFMWFATRDGLNRYDGSAFVVYKHNPNDSASLSSNFIEDLVEDDHGYLWISTNTGVNKFDPINERFTRYLHDPQNAHSVGGTYITRIARDRRGYLWFGTLDGGLDKFDHTTGVFTHYHNDSDGQFVGRINQIVEDSREDIWFTADRGLFHLNRRTGQITRPPATSNALMADRLCADSVGRLWMVADSPNLVLVKYDPQTELLTRYPLRLGAAAGLGSRIKGGSLNGNLVADGQNGLWVPSSDGLYYFDGRTERFTRGFQHDETNADSLDSNAIMSVYQDRGGVLWVGTENAGLNVLNFRQEQFVHYMHRPSDANSISPGRVKAIYQERNGVLWVGFFPRVLDRIDRSAGEINHRVPKPGNGNTLGQGTNVNAIYKDAAGYLWVGGGGSGLDRFDERTGRFKHYRHDPNDPNSLPSDNVVSIYGDRNRHMWVGGQYGISRYDPATDRFTTYLPVPTNPASLLNWIWAIYEDRSGTLWLGSFGGALIRFDVNANIFMAYSPDPHDSHKLSGAGLTSIHEDRSGTLWVGAFDGLYRFNRQAEAFDRYTENQGLPSSTIRCIQEDRSGRLWLSTQKGLSRFDPTSQTFRNYDVSDGLQSNEFSDGCYQGPNGELFFGGSNGFNSLFPGNIRDNPYVPPVVITSFRISNKLVPIGAKAVLKKAITYVESLTLSYTENDVSFEFAALSYANSRKNRYRYKLESYDSDWTDADSKHALATYTNLEPGEYVFRVKASNSDGVWNEQGVSLPILITPPFWKTNLFRAFCATVLVTILWTAYRLRVRQLQHAFNMRLQARVEERTRIARELHDTLLQSFQALVFFFQAARNLLPGRTEEAIRTLDEAIRDANEAITEGRNAIQGLRADPAQDGNLEHLLTAAGNEFARSSSGGGNPPAFQVTVEGARQPLSPLLHDEVCRIARELLRNAFHHAHASRIEIEITYDGQFFRLRVRDNGKGIDRTVVETGARPGHWGLPGMRERAKKIGARLELWSQPGAGTEAEVTVPARIAYGTVHRREGLLLFAKRKYKACPPDKM